MKYLLAFLVLFVFLFVHFESVNREQFIAPNSRKQAVVKMLDKHKDSIEILILGDSHFEYGIRQVVVNERIFNFSISGANYIQSYYLLKKYIDELTSLQYVVLPLDIHSFSSMRSDRLEYPYFWNRYLDYKELVLVKGFWAFEQRVKSLTLLCEYYGKNLFFRQYLHNLLREAPYFQKALNHIYSNYFNDITVNIREVKTPLFQVFDSNNNNIQKIGAKGSIQERVDFHFKGHDPLDKDLLLYFKKILMLCKKHQVKVVTIQTPLSSEYIELASKYITSKELKDKILKHSEYNQYIYSNIDLERMFSSLDSYIGWGGDHLNPDGHRVFVKVFYDRLLGIVYKNESSSH